MREDPNRFKSARKIAVFFLLAALASQAHADCLQIITHTENVRVRESANLNSRVIGKLEKNVAVSAVPFGKDWFEIAGGDYPGAFVSGQYVVFTINRDSTDCTLTQFNASIQGTGVRLRSEPNLTAPIVGSLGQPDRKVVVSLGPPGWLKIVGSTSKSAFVSESLVTIVSEIVSAPGTHRP